MADLKEIVTGTMAQALGETIDANTLYNLKDLFDIVSTVNAKMTTEYVQSGFYKKDAYVLCTDDGDYKKGVIYRFTGYNFVPFATIPEVVKAISALSTDEQVPSAKLVYDKITEERNYVDANKAPKSAVQINDDSELGGIVRDTASNVMGGTINKDKLYNITDLQGIIITNAQMTAAITPAQEGLFKNKDIRYCVDEGTYEKGFYQFTVNYATSSASWVKVDAGAGGDFLEKNNPVGTGSFSLNRQAGTTIGNYSFAEGYNNEASGIYSHAENGATTASGDYSHAEGDHTTAQRKSQHTFGEYNILDTQGTTSSRGTYVEIVGNGTADSSRSNARTLDWSGNEWLAGNLQATGLTDGTDTVTMAQVIAAVKQVLGL